ncbi:serine/threonine-protein kinase Ypk1p [Trichomonascus vanleenenianus]|uniref:serine/threonine-protein kinase Ypk1p n=1 Tax=Trichomonascus vanleenenianus TaxID=2268995 RepID=UPI003EC959D9
MRHPEWDGPVDDAKNPHPKTNPDIAHTGGDREEGNIDGATDEMSTWNLKKLKDSSFGFGGKKTAPQVTEDEKEVTKSLSNLSLPSVTTSPQRKSRGDTLRPPPQRPAADAPAGGSASVQTKQSSSKTLTQQEEPSHPSLLNHHHHHHHPSPFSHHPSASTLTSHTATSNSTPQPEVTTKMEESSSTSSVKPGLLSVSIHKAKGLSLPQSHAQMAHYYYSSSLGSSASPRKPGSLRTPLHQKRPGERRRPPIYLVLEYDKTQIILDAHSGTVDSPVWEKVSNFDVSRVETLNVQLFARFPIASAASGGLSSSHTGASSLAGSVPDKDDAGKPRRRYEDVFLGSCKVEMGAESAGATGTKTLADEWMTLSSGGGGQISLTVKFTPNRTNKHLTIEDFDLLKVVGKGSFGKVMQVRKIDTQQIYALKTIRKAHIVSRSEVNHTLAERTVLAQIDNPFIVPLKFSFQSPEKLYLVLAFVNGGELFHHLQSEGRFDLNRSRFYTAELLCALECLHEYNVIYRDLKPENILLDYTGHIALCDFGLCKLNMAGQEKTNTFCGTPEYLAPELLLCKGYTKVVDWWTLGVLFYEMLTGLPPFYDQDTNEMYRKILQEPLRFPEDMDREARSLLTGLLNRDPEKRLGINGAADIKAHPFFAQIDWKRLMAKKYAAPFKPAVESATDTSNFDQEFTSEEPTDSVVDKDFYLSESVQQQFGGWTFTNDSRLA